VAGAGKTEFRAKDTVNSCSGVWACNGLPRTRANTMAQSIPALVNAKVLRWARETAGLDTATAARKIGRPEEELRQWESGRKLPSVAQMRNAARVYRRPLAAFYLPEPPPDLTRLTDLRRLPSEVPADFSHELRLLIRSARRRQRWIRDLLREVGESPLSCVGCARLDTDVEELSRTVRGLLGVTDEVQASWGTRAEALRDWLDAIEGTGVFVFQSGNAGVKVEEMRGFALPDTVAPVIVVNSKDARSARIFTALHEFVHVLVDEEGISNLVLPSSSTGSAARIEVFCNSVAAETLVPASRLRADWKRGLSDRALDSCIKGLAESYKVSREVIARRLLFLRFITREVYEEKREEYQRDFAEYEETARRKGGEVRIRWERRVVAANGRAFTRAVLAALGRGLVSARDVSALLNTKLRFLPRIEAEAFAREIATGRL